MCILCVPSDYLSDGCFVVPSFSFGFFFRPPVSLWVLPLCVDVRECEQGKFGLGIFLYFKYLRKLSLVMLIISVLVFPMLFINGSIKSNNFSTVRNAVTMSPFNHQHILIDRS